MKLTVALETRFVRVGDDVYSHNLSYQRFWSRYLRVFEDVAVFARCAESNEVPRGWHSATGNGVRFVKVPFYLGPAGFLRALPEIVKAARRAAEASDACSLRVPGLMGTMLWRELRRLRRPYGVEVVGDPWDVFAPGGVRVPLRPLVRRLGRRQLILQCRHAAAALYVTKNALQERYPTRGFHVACSDVSLTEADFISPEQLEQRLQMYRISDWPRRGRIRCVHIGTMEQQYKRQDLLIRAVGVCRRRELDLELVLVGEGKHAENFRSEANALGLADVVFFTGQLPAGHAIRETLDQADLFVLPSLTEGLPRVALEAMARGVPILASDVGGLPEILQAQHLFPVDATPEQLANDILRYLANRRAIEASVRINYQVATEYREEALVESRTSYLQALRGRTVGS